MDKVLYTKIVTRGYELSASGVLAPSTLLRYLEHSRWQTMTSDDALIPVRRFWTLGVVRAQAIEIFKNVGFHVELSISLWVSRVGRTSFDFSHAIERTKDGALVALSTATVVSLDSQRRPTRVTDEAQQYVVTGRPTVDIPKPVEPAEGGWTTEVIVRPSDHDLQQHVNHARYAEFVDDVRIACARSGGYGPGSFEQNVRQLRLEYERETRFGTQVTARTSRIPSTDTELTFELRDGNGLLLRAREKLWS
jgi:acyl-CoA thioesterase FadM